MEVMPSILEKCFHHVCMWRGFFRIVWWYINDGLRVVMKRILGWRTGSCFLLAYKSCCWREILMVVGGLIRWLPRRLQLCRWNLWWRDDWFEQNWSAAGQGLQAETEKGSVSVFQCTAFYSFHTYDTSCTLYKFYYALSLFNEWKREEASTFKCFTPKSIGRILPCSQHV